MCCTLLSVSLSFAVAAAAGVVWRRLWAALWLRFAGCSGWCGSFLFLRWPWRNSVPEVSQPVCARGSAVHLACKPIRSPIEPPKLLKLGMIRIRRFFTLCMGYMQDNEVSTDVCIIASWKLTNPNLCVLAPQGVGHANFWQTHSLTNNPLQW